MIVVGINHEGHLSLKMVKLAVILGANIIKHQTHIIEDEMSKEADSFKISYVNQSIYEIMKRCALSKENEHNLKKYIEKKI